MNKSQILKIVKESEFNELVKWIESSSQESRFIKI
jgi:hypothetical protein